MVIPDFDYDKDIHPTCYRCDAGSVYTHCEEYDQRFNRGICSELDRIERESWTATVKDKQRRILETKLLAQAMSMRSRDRTPDEEFVANKRHELACSADPEKLEEADLSLDECVEMAYDEF